MESNSGHHRILDHEFGLIFTEYWSNVFVKCMNSISERTPVQVGLFLAVIGIFLGGLWASAWWGGVTQTKLESVQKSLDSITSKFPMFDASIVAIASRVQILEVTGSPALRAKLDIIEKEFHDLRRRVEQHILIDERPKP
jgi:hypothetical protein